MSARESVHERLYRYVKGKGRKAPGPITGAGSSAVREADTVGKKKTWSKFGSGSERHAEHAASAPNEMQDLHSHEPDVAGKATEEKDAQKRASKVFKHHVHKRGEDMVVAGFGRKRSASRKAPMSHFLSPTEERGALLAAAPAGLASTMAHKMTFKAAGIAGDEIPQENAMKKKYRDFIHGSTIDQVLFENDIDGNRVVEVRDFHRAAGTASSTQTTWGDFGQGGGYGSHPEHRVTVADVQRASFKPRRKAPVAHLDAQVDEILTGANENAEDTAYQSNPLYDGAAGATSLDAGLVAARAADPTMKPRRTNRLGQNSSFDAVVFGHDLDDSAADDHLEDELYSGHGVRSNMTPNPFDVSVRRTDALTDKKLYGETRVVPTSGSGMAAEAAADSRDFGDAAGASTLHQSTRRLAETYVEFRRDFGDKPDKNAVILQKGYSTTPEHVTPSMADEVIFGANLDGSDRDMPDQRFGPGAPFEGGAGSGANKKNEVVQIKSDILLHTTKRKDNLPPPEDGVDKLLYGDVTAQQNVTGSSVDEPRGSSRGFDGGGYAAGVEAKQLSSSAAAAGREGLIDGRVDMQSSVRKVLPPPASFDLINGGSSDALQQLSKSEVFEGSAGASSALLLEAKTTKDHKRTGPLEMLQDPFTHSGALPKDNVARFEYSRLYGDEVKSLIFNEPAEAKDRSRVYDEKAGLPSEKIADIRGQGDKIAKMDNTPLVEGPPEHMMKDFSIAGKRGSYTEALMSSKKAMVPAETQSGDISGASAFAVITHAPPPTGSPEARAEAARGQGKQTSLRDGAFDAAGGTASEDMTRGILRRMHTGARPVPRPNPVFASNVDKVVFGADTDGSPELYFDGKKMQPYDGAGVKSSQIHRRSLDMRTRKGRVVSSGFMNASSIDINSNVNYLTGEDPTQESTSGLMYELFEDSRKGKVVDLTTEQIFHGRAGTSSGAQALSKILGDPPSRMHFPPAVLPGHEFKGAESAEGVAVVVFDEKPKSAEAGRRASVMGIEPAVDEYGAAAGKSTGGLRGFTQKKRLAGSLRRGSILTGKMEVAARAQVDARALSAGGLSADERAGSGMAGLSSDHVLAVNESRHAVVSHRPRSVPHDHGTVAQSVLGGQAGVCQARANEDYGRFMLGVHGGVDGSNASAGDTSDVNARIRYQFESHLESGSEKAKRKTLPSRFRNAAGNKLSLESASLRKAEALRIGQRSAPSSARSQRSDRSRGTPRSRRTPRSGREHDPEKSSRRTPRSAGKATGTRRSPRARRARLEDVDGGSVADALHGWFGAGSSSGGLSPRRSRSAPMLRGGEAGVLALRATRVGPGEAYETALSAGRSMLSTPYTGGERGPLDGGRPQLPGVAGDVSYGGTMKTGGVDRDQANRRGSYVALTRARQHGNAAGGFKLEDLSMGGTGNVHPGRRSYMFQRGGPAPFGVDPVTSAATEARFQTSASQVGGHQWISGSVAARLAAPAQPSGGFRSLGASTSSSALVAYSGLR